jgi:hypothetical protein
MTQNEEFYEFVESVCKPQTYNLILSEVEKMGRNEELKPSDIFPFYYDLMINLGIMFAPTPEEKKAAFERCNKNINLTKQTILFVFIRNHF